MRREIASADFLYFQRGFNDPRLRGRKAAFAAFLDHLDAVHTRGTAVVYQSKTGATSQLEYNLAGYFLVDGGADGVGSDRGGGPTRWWPGYDVALGDAVGPRYQWKGVLRRDFTNGIVLLNAPGGSARTLTLPQRLVDLRGRSRTAVTLTAARGAVLRVTP